MNRSNDSSLLRIARHASYVSFPEQDDCKYLHRLSGSEQCAFVASASSCRDSQFYFNYIQFLYCTIGSDSYAFWAGMLSLVVLCLFYFMILGITADKFFCPSLAVIAKILNMSESLAGMTILAFGNGSPDLFTALANPDADTELMYAELMGSSFFVIGMIGGAILCIRPFQFRAWSVSRDIGFFLLAVLWIAINIYDNEFSVVESAILIAIYVVFLTLVVAEFFWLKKELNRTHSRVSMSGGNPDDDEEYQNIRQRAELVIQYRDLALRMERQTHAGANLDSILDDCLKYINPIDAVQWVESSWYAKTFAIVRAPILLFLIFVIPIVDYNEPRNGWCKLLNMLHCFLVPAFLLWQHDMLTIVVLNAPVYYWLLSSTAILMVIVYHSSRIDHWPDFHKLYSLLAFVASIQVIYLLAQEVVSVLETIGLVLQLSRSILGLSFLAWGNSIGDLFSNIALARQGYGKMAFAACFGGPLLNLCIGLGITLMSKAFVERNWLAYVRSGVMGKNCETFLVQLFLSFWISLLFTRFQGRRSVGFILLLTYVTFLIFCFMGEFEFIHPYGTDHRVGTDE